MTNKSTFIPIWCPNCEREITRISTKFLEAGEIVNVYCSMCGFQTIIKREKNTVKIEVSNPL
jgi:ribosomal protein S27E